MKKTNNSKKMRKDSKGEKGTHKYKVFDNPRKAVISLGPKGLQILPVESEEESTLAYATHADLDQTATLLQQVLDARSRAMNDTYNRLAGLVEENRKMGLGRVLLNTWKNWVADLKWVWWSVKQSLHRSIE